MSRKAKETREEYDKERSKDCRGKEEDKEYSSEEGRGDADRTAARTAAARRRTMIANHQAGTT